jgi:hypothetical protein
MHKIEEAYLSSQTSTDQNQRSVNLVGSLHSSKNSLPSTVGYHTRLFFVNRFGVRQQAHVCELLLSASQMQELAVRCMKESNTER